MIKNYLAKTIYNTLVKNYPYCDFLDDNKGTIRRQVEAYLNNAYTYAIFEKKKTPIILNVNCSYDEKVISFITFQNPSMVFIYTQLEERKKGLGSSLLCHVNNVAPLNKIQPFGFCENHFNILKSLVKKTKLPIKVQLNIGTPHPAADESSQ